MRKVIQKNGGDYSPIIKLINSNIIMEEKNINSSNMEEVAMDNTLVDKNANNNNNQQMFLIGLAGVVGAIIISFVVFGLVRVYVQAATDKATAITATVLRLPLAKIDSTTIYYSEYLDDLRAIKTLRDYESNNGGMMGQLTDEVMVEQVLWRLINNIFITNLAKSYGVTVDKSEVEDLKNEMIAQFETAEEATKELMDRYGWTLATYEKKVIKPYILQQKLSERLQTDLDLRNDVKERAEKVLAEIKAGGDFEALAMKYGEDSTASLGGDLDWFAKGDMVPQFEVAAFDLDINEISQELVESPFGYHIIRVDGKRVNEETKAEEVRARHIIFLFPSLEQSLDKAIQNAKSQTSWYVKKIKNPIDSMSQ